MLTDSKLRALQPSERMYKVADRDGLYVAVTPGGTKSFRYNYTFQGKQRTINLGKYDLISLAEARVKLHEIKQQIAQGLNPALEKAVINPYSRHNSQHTVAKWLEKWQARQSLSKNSIDAAQRAVRRLGDLAHQSVFTIRTADIHAVLEGIKQQSPASARLFLIYIKAIFQYAINSGLDFINPASSIKSSVIGTLPIRDRVLTSTELHHVFRAINDTRYASKLQPVLFKLLLLTLTRKSELLQAHWAEVDLEQKRWVIPASRMKNKKPHIVYLSDQAVALFREAYNITQHTPYVFGQSGDKVRARSYIDKFIYKLIANHPHIKHFTLHDLRRTGSTMLNEMGYPNEWVEETLSHYRSGISAVYNRASYASNRMKMMQEWADHIGHIIQVNPTSKTHECRSESEATSINNKHPYAGYIPYIEVTINISKT